MVLSSTSTINNEVTMNMEDMGFLVSSAASTLYVDPGKLKDMMIQVEEVDAWEEVDAVSNSLYKELLFSH